MNSVSVASLNPCCRVGSKPPSSFSVFYIRSIMIIYLIQSLIPILYYCTFQHPTRRKCARRGGERAGDSARVLDVSGLRRPMAGTARRQAVGVRHAKPLAGMNETAVGALSTAAKLVNRVKMWHTVEEYVTSYG